MGSGQRGFRVTKPLSTMQVEEAGEKVVKEVSRALDPLLEASAYRDLGRCQPCVVHDTINNAVWIHVMKGSHVRPCAHGLRMLLTACGERAVQLSLVATRSLHCPGHDQHVAQLQPAYFFWLQGLSAAGIQLFLILVLCGWQASEAMKQQEPSVRALGLRHPRDRNGKAISERYATPELECALEEYRKSCAAAHAAVHEQLVLLAQRLEVRSLERLGTFSVG